MDGHLFCIEVASEICLQSLAINFESFVLRVHDLTPSYRKTCIIVNGLDHLDLSFPRNNRSLKLKRSTYCP